MFEILFEEKYRNKVIVLSFAVIILICVIFISEILNSSQKTSLYFFNIGQGDSQLIDIKEGSRDVQFLIDGGPPNSKVLYELSEALDLTDRYIDVIFLSHPQLDHFGGLIEVINNYKVGVFIYSGVRVESASFMELEKSLKKNNVPLVKVSKGDLIKYNDFIIEVIHPGNDYLFKENINESSLVLKFKYKEIKALFTGDIGKSTEEEIIQNSDISANILKVPHHGSRYSSSISFLRRVNPDTSIIQVGKNSYGHPTKEVINSLSLIGSQVFRNDLDGTIRIDLTSDKINIYKNENSK